MSENDDSLTDEQAASVFAHLIASADRLVKVPGSPVIQARVIGHGPADARGVVVILEETAGQLDGRVIAVYARHVSHYTGTGEPPCPGCAVVDDLAAYWETQLLLCDVAHGSEPGTSARFAFAPASPPWGVVCSGQPRQVSGFLLDVPDHEHLTLVAGSEGPEQR